MAQWWHASMHHQLLHQHFTSHRSLHAMHAWSSITVRSFMSSALWEDLISPKPTPDAVNPDKPGSAVPSISCFCDDDPPLTEHPFDKSGNTVTLGTKLEIRYSPWAISMLNGFDKVDRIGAKEFTGGPTGGGRGDDGDGGDDGGGGGEDEGNNDTVGWLPFLTIAFAAFHLGYCIAVWMKDETLDVEFIRVGVGLFCLLAVAAIRLNNQTGLDAFVLGLGASIGVMLWTGVSAGASDFSGFVGLYPAQIGGVEPTSTNLRWHMLLLHYMVGDWSACIFLLPAKILRLGGGEGGDPYVGVAASLGHGDYPTPVPSDDEVNAAL